MGNAVTDDYNDLVGTFEYWWTHGLISDDTYHELNVKCDNQSTTHPSEECNKILEVAGDEMGNIDPYSIYTRTCNNSASLKRIQNGHYVGLFEYFPHSVLQFFSSIYQLKSKPTSCTYFLAALDVQSL